MNDALDRLAESHGIQLAYISELGERHIIDDTAKTALLRVLGVDPEQGPAGSFDEAADAPSQSCYLPKFPEAGAWGIACQLYSLRSGRSLGIGDFEDLARLAEIGGPEGASFVGVNPLHALFLSDPGRFSPYAPSSRRFLNPFYIAIDQLDGGPEAIEALRRSEPERFEDLDGELVDYPKMGALKTALLRAIFRQRFEAIRQDEGFVAFCAGGDEGLRDFALFEALSADMMTREGHYSGWHTWPDEFKDRGGDAVRVFAAENEEAILFHSWLQYQAEEQLAAAQARAVAAGMSIGLYLDFAVGVSPDGADTWAAPELTIRDARIGSPPDMFNSSGQDWGIAPLSPKGLAEHGFAPLREAVEALMRNAGAVRIDHAMGLARLWWIPTGVDAHGGGYVRFPLGRTVDVVAETSQANQCIVIGEDLGTVPPGFRHTMGEAKILSYRLLYFERHGETGFLMPEAYPEIALACISTHDLPTLRGWWKGTDMQLRADTGRQDAEATERTWDERRRDRRALVLALKEAGLLPEAFDRIASGEDSMPPEVPTSMVDAIHRFIARTRSRLVAVQLDDMIGAERQPNLPGTTDEYPNWRIRSIVPLEALPTHERFRSLAAAMRQERPNADGNA
ncbi:4-alpha-glucanotransferase [Aurantimonas sp. MSK8Z-1]|uniref:4-alpha-glucanotransferase n=1 Tax=Mangrovibrevibacter kandeliae TaxID=2968473 RepID=UPI0021193934|nr:4-alpha-glucanotransferase [Aurantimonas sp. MSK8Z-1]MCW4113394.1 4-alpha-glucanotransferase [Aurantimonas sp. MSK8Z-1]